MAKIYLKLGDVKGESMDARFPGWIPLESFSLGGQINQTTGGAGQGAGQQPQITDIQLSKFTDRSSADLAQAVAKGTVFGTAVIAIAGIDEGMAGSVYVMENVLITSYTSGAGGSDRPVESLSLNFSKLTFGSMAQVRMLNTMLQMGRKAVQSARRFVR